VLSHSRGFNVEEVVLQQSYAKNLMPKTPNELLELTIDSIGFEGAAIARHNDVVHFVKGAVAGERVMARVVRKHRRHVEAELIEVIEPSPNRVVPPCQHFGVCGGCHYQHIDQAMHASLKRQHVEDAIHRIAHLPDVAIETTCSSNPTYGYRNKMEFSFGASRWLTREEIDSGKQFNREFALGLHVPGRFDKVRSIHQCALQHNDANAVLSAVHHLAQAREIEAYHQRNHTGFARHLVIRRSTLNGALLVVIITTTPQNKNEQGFVEDVLGLFSQLPEGSSVLHAVNDSWSPVATGVVKEQRGPGHLVEKIADILFEVSPFSFFQTNTYHVESLVHEALQQSHLQQTHIAWDLYCGTGTLSLPAAKRCKQIIGLELSQSSIADAQRNANANGINNAQFAVVDLHVPKALPVLRELPHPECVLVDPPRNGMHGQVVEHLMHVMPNRIVYVSCQPATLARDLQTLSERYDVQRVVPVDMFPQTYHVESVATLVKRS
jgi:23S rRNA (uracil1939-C5)-methyltransferase